MGSHSHPSIENRMTAGLQLTATYYDKLCRTATHCNLGTLQHTATFCNTWQHTATHCNAL